MTRSGPIRINRFLAQAGIASRRKADELIETGRVRVNGKLALALGARIDPASDTLELDGEPVLVPGRRETVKLYKPLDVISTLHDPGKRKTVKLLMERAGFEERFFPVGRLDRDTTGLLLMTTDGDLCYRLTHPSFKIEKRYTVRISGSLEPEHLQNLRDGIVLEDGPTQPCEVRLLERGREFSEISMILREGRKRQVRRMLESQGYRVDSLHRDAVGPVELGDMPVGSIRRLAETEWRALYRAVGLDAES